MTILDFWLYLGAATLVIMTIMYLLDKVITKYLMKQFNKLT